ncbi:MAG: hypothetical protein DRJ42_28010 [Deltaproteobacteria bacterium]|nr:MAG: hypothetical protein DRJ42_28010 [Deltaproteobacteria bacterium]
MELNQRQERVWAAMAFVAVAGLLFFGLHSFGIWDPWELNTADEARHLLSGEVGELTRPAFMRWFVAAGFAVFGVNEWAGRLGVAAAGLVAVALAFLLVRRFAGRRAGVYAAVIAGTSPLFLFNSRQMLGDAPAFAAHGMIALGALSAIYRPAAPEADEKARTRNTVLWLLLALAGVVVGTATRGALLGALAPLGAVALAAVYTGTLKKPDGDDRVQTIAAWAVVVSALALAAVVANAVVADVAGYSSWLGGKPRGGDPPTFDAAIETIFHGFAPWSTILPLAIGWLMLGGRDGAAAHGDADAEDVLVSPDQDEAPQRMKAAFRLSLLLWAAIGYGALTLFEARYGPGTFVPVVALAAAVAVLLRDIEGTKATFPVAAVVGALFTGLIIRDFSLYPGGPVAGLAVDELTVPEVFNPRRYWAVVLGLFGAAVVLGFLSAPVEKRKLDLKAPYRYAVSRWREGNPAVRLWMIAGGILVAVFPIWTVVVFAFGDSLGLTVIVAKWSKRLGLVVVAVPILIAGAQAAWAAAPRIGRHRFIPLLVAGVIVGGYAAQGYLPALSAHFSPREVYDTFNSHAAEGEVLGEYRVGGRAAAYYADGQVREIQNQAELLEFLGGDERRWAAFPADELAAIDRAYRRQEDRHLFIADARSARVVLATNQPIEGVEDQNFIAEFVTNQEPTPEFPVNATLDNKIVLLGYDLEIPHDGYVGSGEDFVITWYWKCLAPSPGSWKMFVHIDGNGNRVHGDHEPVEDRYPVRLWDEGDIVIDRQELTVPGNYRPGNYSIFIGLYAGDTRMTITDGPSASENRIRAGVMVVR